MKFDVGGRLNVCDTEVITLPRDLFVGEDIISSDSLVTRLPTGMSIGGTYRPTESRSRNWQLTVRSADIFLHHRAACGRYLRGKK